MNLAEIRQIVKDEGRVTTTSMDALIDRQVMVKYRMLGRRNLWPQLRVDNAEMTADTASQFYFLPYVFDRLYDESLRYDVTASQGGVIVNQGIGTQLARYRSFAPTTIPANVAIAAGTGAALYSTGTATVGNRGTAVTGTGTVWTTALHVGQYVVFHIDSMGANGGDFGYQIASRSGDTSITLATPYRGPSLADASYEIRPANNPRLTFDPAFTEDGKVIACTYQRKPARLYNDEDSPEVDALSEAVAYEVLASMAQFHGDDTSRLAYYLAQARVHYREAMKTSLF